MCVGEALVCTCIYAMDLGPEPSEAAAVPLHRTIFETPTRDMYVGLALTFGDPFSEYHVVWEVIHLTPGWVYYEEIEVSHESEGPGLVCRFPRSDKSIDHLRHEGRPPSGFYNVGSKIPMCTR